MSEWVSEWVSAGLLFAKANEELTYKHLGTRNDVQKLQVSVCLESLVMKRIMNEVCTYLYKSLGKLIVKSWSPKGMGFFNHKTEKSQDSFDSKDPMNGPQDLSKNHGWTDSLLRVPTQINPNLNFALSYYGQILPTVLQQASLIDDP
jgi:hypothetical protein